MFGRFPRVRKTLCGFALVVLAAIPSASIPRIAQTEEPGADEIVSLAVSRANRQRESNADLKYESTISVITEHLRGDGSVDKTETETRRQYSVEGVLFEELIARDGEPLDEDDLRDEFERKEDFAEDVRERRVKGEELVPKGEFQVDFDQEFVDRYEYSLVGETVIRGHSCWIIYLVPRDGDAPENRNIEKALNNSTGHLYISKDDYGLVRVEFEMARSARFWWGLLGTLRDYKGQLEFIRVGDSVWFPSSVEIQLDMRILIRSRRRRVVRTWNDYSSVAVADYPKPLAFRIAGSSGADQLRTILQNRLEKIHRAIPTTGPSGDRYRIPDLEEVGRESHASHRIDSTHLHQPFETRSIGVRHVDSEMGMGVSPRNLSQHTFDTHLLRLVEVDRNRMVRHQG